MEVIQMEVRKKDDIWFRLVLNPLFSRKMTPFQVQDAITDDWVGEDIGFTKMEHDGGVAEKIDRNRHEAS
jgi:hypothetical protein